MEHPGLEEEAWEGEDYTALVLGPVKSYSQGTSPEDGFSG